MRVAGENLGSSWTEKIKKGVFSFEVINAFAGAIAADATATAIQLFDLFRETPYLPYLKEHTFLWHPKLFSFSFPLVLMTDVFISRVARKFFPEIEMRRNHRMIGAYAVGMIVGLTFFDLETSYFSIFLQALGYYCFAPLMRRAMPYQENHRYAPFCSLILTLASVKLATNTVFQFFNSPDGGENLFKIP